MKKIMSMMTLALTALATPAMAAGLANGALDVSTTAVASCTVTSSPINFGTYDGTADVRYLALAGFDCTAPLALPRIQLNGGANPGAGAERNMVDRSGNRLGYQIYTDSFYLHIWGLSPRSMGIPNITTFSFPIRAAIPAAQAFVPGVYTDQVNIDLLF